ncbi:MAG: universal stress protein [Flavobacteriales bacterium]|nr:universal stress protein [Flavobacteriales bacterium]
MPTDFPKVADNAISHAMRLAKHTGAEVYLRFHVVANQDENGGDPA